MTTNSDPDSKQTGDKYDVEPRLESFIIPWGDMTDDQRTAARQTLELLVQIAKAPPSVKRLHEGEESASAISFLPHIDPERRNHVVLIDGERGSGKTALLITLLYALEQPVLNQPPTKATKELSRYLGDTKRRIVPLEHIDLLPLPPGTNLAMHLTSVLQKIVLAMEATAEPGYLTSTGIQPERGIFSSRREMKSRTYWRKLLKSVAAGREGNLSKRRAHVDPETYAFELEQAERERLELDASFRAFVDALVVDYKEWSGLGAEPLFVFAVDDADMNPRLCLELLELVRTLWHPRVAFVLTGNSQTFLDVIEVSLKEHLQLPEHAASRLRTLAQQIYEKTIPLSQRNVLKPLTRDERMSQVRALLAQESLPLSSDDQRSQRARSLLDFFILQPQLLDVFPSRLRALNDLVAHIQRRLAWIKDPVERVSCIFEEIWSLALGDPRIPHEQITQFTDLISRHEGLRSFVVTTGPLRLRDVPRIFSTGVTENNWRIDFVRPVRTEMFGGDLKLVPARLTAALLLAVNVAEHMVSGLAEIEDRQLALGALVHPRFEVPVSIPWPLPDFPTLLDGAMFSVVWEMLSPRRFKLENEAVDRLARRFLRAVCWFANHRDEISDVVLRGGGERQLTDSMLKLGLDEIIRQGGGSESWEIVSREISSLAKGIGGQEWSKRFASWALLSTGLMAAPEAGLSYTGARELLEGLRRNLEPIWSSLRASLRLRRVAHVELNARWKAVAEPKALREVARGLIEQIDTVASGHPWFVLIGAEEGVGGGKFEFNPEATLRGVHVAIASRSSVPGMETLADYVTPARNGELATLPSELVPSWLAVANNFAVQQRPAALLYELWKIATSGDDSGVAVLVRFEESTQSLEVDDILPRVDIGNFVSENQIANFGLSFSSVTPPGPPEMSAYQYALYRIIWDFRADAQDQDADDVPRAPDRFPAFWPGLLVRRLVERVSRVNSHVRHIQWPTIAWPAIIDWEVMFSGWQGGLNQQRSRIRSGKEELLGQSVDWLGFTYLRTALSVFQSRAVANVRTVDELGVDEWRELGLGLLSMERLSTGAGVRLEEFKRWLNRVRVMAAPESGLSKVAALGLIEAMGELGDRARQELRAVRRMHLADQVYGSKMEDVELVVGDIDRACNDHPWVTRIEKPPSSTLLNP
ncbi:hypothetical protein ACJ2CR_22960 [Myxococcus faecalis]|uniref:hypothetical protein n=1 Tax=Myxococcus faecalis TaxID=3115646 RepID=UPI0038D1E884